MTHKTRISMNRLRCALIAVVAVVLAGLGTGLAAHMVQAAQAKEQPYVVEYYYKAKWGHADEFLTLFKKNHLPVLRKETELGRMLNVTMVAPRLHATEDGRWDFRQGNIFLRTPD